jgi:ribonuclease Z
MLAQPSTGRVAITGNPKMKTRTIVFLALPLLAVAALYTQRVPLSLAMVERGAARNMAGNPFAALPDGIHVALCGAGGPLADPRRSGPCVAVRAGTVDLVIDAGTGGARNLGRMRFPLGGIDAVLLTHFHSDHIDGLGELAMQRWVNAANTTPLPVLGPEGVSAVVAGFNAAYAQDAIYRHAHHGDTVAPLAGHGMSAQEWPLPAPGEATLVLDRDGVKVTMFAVDHAPVSPAVGYRIDYAGRSVVVSGDTARSANLEAMARGADLLLHEALSPQLVMAMNRGAAKAARPIAQQVTTDILDYHASPVEAAESGTAAGVKHLLYYHIVPPLILPGMQAVFLDGVVDAYAGAVTVGVDGTLLSLPTGTREVRELDNAL